MKTCHSYFGRGLCCLGAGSSYRMVNIFECSCMKQTPHVYMTEIQVQC